MATWERAQLREDKLWLLVLPDSEKEPREAPATNSWHSLDAAPREGGGEQQTCKHPPFPAGAYKSLFAFQWKYLTLCGKARERESREGWWRWWNAGIDPCSSKNHYLQSGGLNSPGAMHCHHVPPSLLMDWSDLRTLIKDIYTVTSPCYPSIHLLHMIKGPVMIIIVQLTGLTMKLNLLYFISVSKWTF